MLVNVITRYAPPAPQSLSLMQVENVNEFGMPAVSLCERLLHPAIVQNQQGFGNNVVKFAPQQVEPVCLSNMTIFGAHSVANIIPGTDELLPTPVLNSTLFGGQRVHFTPRLLAPGMIVNAHQFGAPTIASPEKHFSYSNPLGTGDRTATIVVTTSGGSVFDSPSRLVNGNTSENVFWGFGAISFKFDLGAAKIIQQARWRQDTSTTHSGLFQWQGSNDDVSYADIGGTFNLGGAPVTHHDALLGNNTTYRYYRLEPTAGASISGTPYLREVEFYIEGAIDDPPD